MSAPTDPDVPEAVTYREIQEILRTFRDSGWTGMTVDLHGMRITVGKDGPPRGAAATSAAPQATHAAGPAGAVAGDGGDDRRTGPHHGGFPPRTGPDGRSSDPTSADVTAPGAGGTAAPGAGPLPAAAPPGSPLGGPPPAGDAAVDLSGCVDVLSPAVGAFWVAPSPGQPPFVGVGQTVARDEQLAIVEVMKLMNPVVSTVAGTVVQVCAANADLVEYEQVLFRIRPSDE
ncbi:acetyl-CoA carboxylase biotin carboxyl carrier protein [Pseudonocardia endophytica]|uniref:Biotin carboxyl carrier protein of acetyl-CoA carboxylase n=1 Tax=Pseudonocardia endophytica TaxID=401976 RepID=A0A4R1HT87_PSEEN|nr:biotin/lipoyl-containing protein [Pseudonocardia endophytica]TCK25877.1 acetyl-CoA carboxylase biotin carboxyl carrier protein [Pseudonocardia endophytica]